MNTDEVESFEVTPYLEKITQVRLVDDAGKVADMKTYPFAHFKALLQTLVDNHANRH